MMRLLREHQLATEFRRLKARRGAIAIAAPFWGLGAARTLGLRQGPEIRILCRFDSPACNPNALLELADAGASIRSHRRLHAKLYVTDAAIILGSSNPSRYGLTQEGDVVGGTVEANILTDEPGVVGEVRGLFEQLWGDTAETSRVTRRMIESEIRRRELDPPVPPPRRLAARSLLAACREAPDLFGLVLVAAYDRRLDPGGRNALGQLQRQSAAADDEIGVADFRRAWGYGFGEPPPAGSWIIDLDCKGSVPRVWGASRVPTPALVLRVPGENDVTPTIRGIVSVPGARGVFRLSAQDKVDLCAIAPKLLRGRGDYVALPRVVAMFDRGTKRG